MSEPKRNAPRPHGPGRGMMPTEKAKDFKGSFKKLISYLSPFKFKILIVVIFAALSTVFTIVGPKILAKATDELTAGLMRIITGAAEGIDFGYICCDNWDSFLTAFDFDFKKVGKRHTVDIEGNNNRFRQRLRRVFRKTCCFSKKLENHFKAFDLLFHYVNYGWV